MRFRMARSTKDLDLTVRSAQGRAGDSLSLRERLRLAASIELPDFFMFTVGEAMAELIRLRKAARVFRRCPSRRSDVREVSRRPRSR
jgi:hypothetical protein